jgi:O6-methylguanine-DNA--protein-cysteine methyltransferase
MRLKWQTIPLLVLLAVLALTVAACGGGSNNAAQTTTAAATTAEPETTTEAATTAEETTTEETTVAEATTTAAVTTAAIPDFASSENCREFAEAAAQLGQALQGGASTDLQKVADFYKQLADKAPDEIKADLRVFGDAMQKYADALGDIKPGKTPTPDQIAALQKLQSELDPAKLQAAAQHISAWAQKNCRA